MYIEDSLIEEINQNPGLLRRFLGTHFDHEDKLRNLCQDLHIPYHTLTGQGTYKTSDLAHRLITRKELPQFIEYLEQNEPGLVTILFEHFGVRESNNLTTNPDFKQASVDIIREEKSPSSFKYDVALSFASQEEHLAKRLTQLLQNKGIRVYYYSKYLADTWGKNLSQTSESIYTDEAQYCIVFVSEAYSKNRFTNLELDCIQARAFKQRSEYILPLKVDDTKIPGITSITCYFDLRNKNNSALEEALKQVADNFEQKLRNS